MFDINEEQYWQPYCHPDTASSRDARHPITTLATVLPPRCGIITKYSTSHQLAGNRTTTPMRTSRDVRCQPNLIESTARFLRRRSKQTTNSTHQPQSKTTIQ